MGKLSWIFQVGCECHHKCLYTREARGDYDREEASVHTEAQMMWPQAQGHLEPLEEARDRFLPGASTWSTALPTP